MFNNNQSQPTQDNKTQSPSDTTSATDDGIQGQMYTMPTNINKGGGSSKSGTKKSPLLIIGIVVILVAVIALVVFWLNGSTTYEPDDLLVNGNLLNPNLVNNTEGDIDQEVVKDEVAVEQSSPTERDQQRLEDVSVIRSALAFYYRDNKAYPDISADLLDGYLQELPINPNPGGATYIYIPQDNNQSYKLSFTLESGGELGFLKFSAGDFQANPSLIEPLIATTGADEEESDNSIELISGLDSDNDKLTDIEENLYQTDSILVDSDNDGYSDASELINLYDPSQAGVSLADSETVSEYVNTSFNYSILYPKEWTVRALTEDKSEVIFNSTTTEFVQIMVLDNILGLGAEDWYLQYNSTVHKDDLNEIIVDNTVGIQTADGRHTYLGLGSNIYAIIYNIGTTNQLNYTSTYKMMLNSFQLLIIDEEGLASQRDTQRLSDVTSLRLSLLQYQVANLSLPETIDSDVDTYQMIGSSTDDCALTCGDKTTLSTCLDLTDILIPDYLDSLPYNPLLGTDLITGYYLNLLTDGTLVAGSCQVEQVETIEVSN